MMGLLTCHCVFKVNCFNEKGIAESIGEIMAYFWSLAYLLVLVLPILFSVSI